MKLSENIMDRRRLLCGVAGAGLVAAALAACGGDGTKEGSRTSDIPTEAVGTVLAAASAIPVGGGRVVDGPDGVKVVVVQPIEGTFKAFNAACTHQGTTVNPPNAEGIMVCPNHGSEFNMEDGSVENPPATRPLASISVKVERANIVLA